MTLRRITILVGTIFIFLGLAALLLVDVVVNGAVQHKLGMVQERLGFEIRVSRAHIQGTDAIFLDGVRVGPSDEPLLTMERVIVRLNPDALRNLEVEPSLVEIDTPIVHLRSDGTWRGLWDALQEVVPQRDKSPQTDRASKSSRRRPDIKVTGGKLIDHGGLVQVVNGVLDIKDGAVDARAHFLRPHLGDCRVSGDLSRVEVSCDAPYAHPLPGGFLVEVKEFKASRKPLPSIHVPGLKLRRKDSSSLNVLDALFSGLAADLRIELVRNERQRWPTEIKLLLPGGGEVLGRGDAGLDGLEISAKVKDLAFGHTQRGVGGKLSGQYAVKVSRERKVAWVEGAGRLNGFYVEHPSLAEGIIGPSDLGLAGKATLSLIDKNQKWARVKVEGGRFVIGTIPFDFSVNAETRAGALKVDARCDTKMITGDELVSAIPSGLLPNLQPLEATGKIGLNAFLKLDTNDLDATQFKIRVPKHRFTLTSKNDAISFDALRHEFETRFRVPVGDEDEILELSRVTGPTAERWVPLDEVPPLLPLAIMTQEDGGFYKHGGISMFHLRGSLVDNLKKGRFFRGGSTITMQLARNLFLHRRKTLARKLEEIIIAWLLEENFDKDEMMAFYVNVVEFGPDLYGIGEAAEHYFDKAPIELTPGEVAWIVRLLPSPRPLYDHYRKGQLSRGHTRSINALLRLLVKRGHLSSEEQNKITETDLWPSGTEEREKKDLKALLTKK